MPGAARGARRARRAPARGGGATPRAPRGRAAGRSARRPPRPAAPRRRRPRGAPGRTRRCSAGLGRAVAPLGGDASAAVWPSRGSSRGGSSRTGSVIGREPSTACQRRAAMTARERARRRSRRRCRRARWIGASPSARRPDAGSRAPGAASGSRSEKAALAMARGPSVDCRVAVAAGVRRRDLAAHLGRASGWSRPCRGTAPARIGDP
jgi:hypothetical protein